MQKQKSASVGLLYGQGYVTYTKRLVDIVSSAILIILFFPVAAFIAFLIKLDSPGPIFADVPERVGRDGKPFRMFKFRSMVINAHYLLRHDEKFKKLYDEYKRSSFKLKKDPRITWVGKFIRRHSLDELPQLVNVLRGEMSLVGPRAYYPDELVDQQEKYPHTKELVTRVLSIKPGITGLWQVSGRSDINFDKRIAIDAQYIDNISLWTDLRIILRTPWAMVTGRGAV